MNCVDSFIANGISATSQPRQIGRQLIVGFAAEIMDVRPVRQILRGDLHNRADHHERPVGPHLRDLVEQLGIEALVEHAVEAEARTRQVFLVGGVEQARPGLREVRPVDRRREAMDARVAVLLGFEQARCRQ
jgi:hypothetical protein